MLVGLFSRTLEKNRHLFEPLILEIVRAGITYRNQKRPTPQPEQIDRLNGILLQLGFKFPELWEPEFKPRSASTAELKHRNTSKRPSEFRANSDDHSERASITLNVLLQQFFQLVGQSNRQAAGIEAEKNSQ